MAKNRSHPKSILKSSKISSLLPSRLSPAACHGGSFVIARSHDFSPFNLSSRHARVQQELKFSQVLDSIAAPQRGDYDRLMNIRQTQSAMNVRKLSSVSVLQALRKASQASHPLKVPPRTQSIIIASSCLKSSEEVSRV